MAAVPGRQTPTTDRELALLGQLTAQLTARGLTVEVHPARRELIARQPGVISETGAPLVGLSQAVHLVRSRVNAGALAWLIRLDDGFRGAGGSAFERIAAGDDVAEAARKLGNILALSQSDCESVG